MIGVAVSLLAACSVALFLSSCGKAEAVPAAITPQKMADALHAVLESDRTVYTRNVVNRLQNDEKVIKASEHWKDEKALPLPAQMFRMGAEMVEAKNAGFTYALLSKWPVNPQNSPKTEAEKAGLDFVAEKDGGKTTTPRKCWAGKNTSRRSMPTRRWRRRA